MQQLAPTTDHLFDELDYRESDGIEVSLLWHRQDGSLTVFVTDAKTQESLELPVLAAEARQVFEHPFACFPRPSVGS